MHTYLLLREYFSNTQGIIMEAHFKLQPFRVCAIMFVWRCAASCTPYDRNSSHFRSPVAERKRVVEYIEENPLKLKGKSTHFCLI